MPGTGGGWQELTLSGSRSLVNWSALHIPKMRRFLLNDYSSIRLDVSYSNVDGPLRAMQSATRGYSHAPRPSTGSCKNCPRAQTRSTSMAWPWRQRSDVATHQAKLEGLDNMSLVAVGRSRDFRRKNGFQATEREEIGAALSTYGEGATFMARSLL